MNIGEADKQFLTLLAVSGGAVPLLTYTISYIVVACRGHVATLPFIQEFENRKPESIILSLGFSLTCLIHLTLIYARYMQILTYRHPECPKSNDACCYFGPLMVLGESIVTSVKYSEAAWIYYFGKTIFFASFSVYIGIQAYISVNLRAYHRRWLAYSRWVMTVLSIISHLLSVIGMSYNELARYRIPQSAELALLIVMALFWISIAVDFHDNNIVYLFRYYEVRAQFRNNSVNNEERDRTNENIDRDNNDQHELSVI